MRTSILAGARTDDTGYDAYYNSTNGSFTQTSLSPRTQENMKPVSLKKDLALIRTGIGVYGGAEWNFTGSTFLYGELGFNYGITPFISQTSATLVEKTETGTAGVYDYKSLDINNNHQHIIEFKIGLLF